MDWIIGIENAINFIESHLTDEISYEDIAKQSFLSSYHFQRIFSTSYGFTLGEYIRMRRLSLAAAELADGHAKVIDTALKYGYDSPDSFTKAFVRFHGITPSDARKDGAVLKSFSRLSVNLTLKGGTQMNYRIVELQDTVLTGYKRHFDGVPGLRYEQEKEMYVNTRPFQYILKGMADEPETNYDVITNVGDDGYDFFIAYKLREYDRNNLENPGVLGKEFAGYFENISIPKHTYAVFETERCTHPTTVTLDLRKKIACEWLVSSGYQLADAPELVVTHWFGGEKKNQRYRELWIPIEKA